MSQPTRDTTLLTANQILVRLKARTALIIVTAFLTVLAVTAIVIIVPRAYTSSTDIYVDYRENDPISGFRLSAMLDDSYMRTQLELIRSRVVTERVIELLDLKQTAGYRETVLELGAGPPTTVCSRESTATPMSPLPPTVASLPCRIRQRSCSRRVVMPMPSSKPICKSLAT